MHNHVEQLIKSSRHESKDEQRVSNMECAIQEPRSKRRTGTWTVDRGARGAEKSREERIRAQKSRKGKPDQNRKMVNRLLNFTLFFKVAWSHQGPPP